MGDTYDMGIQLRASRRRYEDALALHGAERWNGAIYMGGYAIECSLKSLICYNEKAKNLKGTKIMLKEKMQGADLHNLERLLRLVDVSSGGPSLKVQMRLDYTGTYAKAWKTVVELWKKDELRYGDKVGEKSESERFMAAVKELHLFLLRKQGQAS